MDQRPFPNIPEDIKNIPASVFVLNPGAQVLLGGIVVLDGVKEIGRGTKMGRKIAGTIAASWASIWAFFHPAKCHKTTWKGHWGRAWMLD